VFENLVDLEPLSCVQCPTCGVPAGKRCERYSGAPRKEPHVNRKLAAIEAVGKEEPMSLDYRNLVLRFEEIKESYAQAKTLEEKRELLALARELVRQADEQVAQLRSEIDRLKDNSNWPTYL
jgi:hypothetical protein